MAVACNAETITITVFIHVGRNGKRTDRNVAQKNGLRIERKVKSHFATNPFKLRVTDVSETTYDNVGQKDYLHFFRFVENEILYRYDMKRKFREKKIKICHRINPRLIKLHFVCARGIRFWWNAKL